MLAISPNYPEWKTEKNLKEDFMKKEGKRGGKEKKEKNDKTFV